MCFSSELIAIVMLGIYLALIKDSPERNILCWLEAENGKKFKL